MGSFIHISDEVERQMERVSRRPLKAYRDGLCKEALELKEKIIAAEARDSKRDVQTSLNVIRLRKRLKETCEKILDVNRLLPKGGA